MTGELGKLKTHSPIYWKKYNCENSLILRHTLGSIYLTNILLVQCLQISLHNDDNEMMLSANKRTRPAGHNVFDRLHTYIHTYIHTCLLLLISMLWHRQAIFESKGDKLSSSAEGRIRTQGLRYLFTSRLNACWQTDWAIEDQAKNLNSTARPYDQQAFSPLDITASWLSHLALVIHTCNYV